jgi:phospholipid/cholesterol/gamma-HCH transport system permease protein
MKSFFCALGEFALYSVRILVRIFDPRRYRLRAVVDQMSRVGVESLTVVNLCAFAIGLVLVVQTTAMLARFGAEARLPTIIATSFVREIGPLFAAIMLTGRVGTGVAAEIGSMVVTEQIDAYRVFGADPLAKLAVPRVIAMTVMLPALTVIACVIGMFSGYLVFCVLERGMSGTLYIQRAVMEISRVDVAGMLIKGMAFGGLIGLISTYIGFRTPRATEAVGQSATATMVRGVLAVLLMDLILTKALLTLGEP